MRSLAARVRDPAGRLSARAGPGLRAAGRLGLREAVPRLARAHVLSVAVAAVAVAAAARPADTRIGLTGPWPEGKVGAGIQHRDDGTARPRLARSRTGSARLACGRTFRVPVPPLPGRADAAASAAIVRPGSARGLVPARGPSSVSGRSGPAAGGACAAGSAGRCLSGDAGTSGDAGASADAGASGGGCACAYAGAGDAGPSGGGCVSGDAGGPARVCHSADDRAAAAARRPVLRLRRAARSLSVCGRSLRSAARLSAGSRPGAGRPSSSCRRRVGSGRGRLLSSHGDDGCPSGSCASRERRSASDPAFGRPVDVFGAPAGRRGDGAHGQRRPAALVPRERGTPCPRTGQPQRIRCPQGSQQQPLSARARRRCASGADATGADATGADAPGADAPGADACRCRCALMLGAADADGPVPMPAVARARAGPRGWTAGRARAPVRHLGW